LKIPLELEFGIDPLLVETINQIEKMAAQHKLESNIPPKFEIMGQQKQIINTGEGKARIERKSP
jgi:hypothetical protein